VIFSHLLNVNCSSKDQVLVNENSSQNMVKSFPMQHNHGAYLLKPLDPGWSTGQSPTFVVVCFCCS
jgi:hypothetical protein